jgi:hypothetical protein
MAASSGDRLGIVCACYSDDPRRRGVKAVQETYLSGQNAVPSLSPFRRRRRVEDARQRAWPTGRSFLAALATPGKVSRWLLFSFVRVASRIP